jgi:hypothetical protein
MAEIRNVNNLTNQTSLTNDQLRDSEIPKVQDGSSNIDGVRVPVGKPAEGEQAGKLKQKDQIMPDVVIGRDSSQLQSAEQVRTTGYISAVDKLLGLDLQPTTLGVLAAPPGNTEILRLMTPAMRRKIMRNLLSKQRERMKRLTTVLKKYKENEEGESSNQGSKHSFAEMLTEEFDLSPEQVNRATEELGRMAGMLDVLDDLLIMQDYTISQMGTFSQG